MISSSISASSDRLTNGSTSCSRVLIASPRAATKARRHEDGFVRRLFVPSCLRGGSWNGDPIDDVGDDAVGGQAVAGRVRPEPDAMVEDVRREILDVVGVDLGA